MNTEEKIVTMMDLGRSRKRWRLLAIILLLVGLFSALAGQKSSVPEGGYIAGVRLDGFIGDNPELTAQLNSFVTDDNVKAVVLYVDSPGGSMQPALDVYHAVRRIASKKPVVARMGQMAASAGYLVAVGADYIIAGEATLTGSVGVFLPLVDATTLADKIGVKSRTIFSGEDKLATSPFDKVSEKSEKYLQSLVNDLQGLFVHYVTDRRQLSSEALATVKTGRSFIGLEAKKLGLIDALSHEMTAMHWLQTEKGLAPDLAIHWLDTQPEPSILGVLGDPLNWNIGKAVHGAQAIAQY